MPRKVVVKKPENAPEAPKTQKWEEGNQTITAKVVKAPTEHTEMTLETLERNKELRRGLERGLFGVNREPRTIKIKSAVINPEVDNLARLEHEFILNRKGKGDAESTVRTYRQHFAMIFDFLGYSYGRQSGEVVVDALKTENFPSQRELGASMPIIVLETDNIATYYQDYVRNWRGRSEQSTISAMRHFKAIVKFAQENGWIRDYKIHIKDVQPDIKKTFTTYELAELTRKPKVEDFVNYRCWVMIKYLMATGNRISSILALNVSDIDFEENSITVNVQKNKKPKLMPLHPSLRKILRDYIHYYRCDDDGQPLDNEPLFCNAYGGRLAYESAKDSMKDYFEARKVEWEGFHKFRHSYAANWIRDGGNPLMLKEQLGHSSLAMTNRYANIYGMATKDEAEQHSLISKVSDKSGRKALKKRED